MNVAENLERAAELVQHSGVSMAGGPLMVAAAQVHVMIAQAQIAAEASQTARDQDPRLSFGWLSGRLDDIQAALQPQARAERMDPAITELLDRAADLLADVEPFGKAGGWNDKARQWMTDWRAYMHASYHRRQPW